MPDEIHVDVPGVDLAPRLLVVGDAIIDSWREGRVDRLSPEAACPVFHEGPMSPATPGGAAAVAVMAANLGARVTFAYAHGPTWRELIYLPATVSQYALGVRDRLDPMKVRLIDDRGQWLRIDNEQPWTLGQDVGEHWAEALLTAIRDGAFDLILLADYGKGVLAPWFLRKLLGEQETPIVVDPARGRPLSLYGGAWGIKWNTAEAEATNYRGEAQWIITTHGRDGCTLTGEYGNHFLKVPKPVALADPTGCGDQFLAALGYCLGVTSRFFEDGNRDDAQFLKCAIEFAQASAGLQAGLPRIGQVTWAETCRELNGSKSLDARRMIAQVAADRAVGRTVVVTNGVFDLLHYGHIRSLAEAKRQGDRLYVLLNSDASAGRIKGRAPMVSEAKRAESLAALECVDWVCTFEEDTPEALVKAIEPDVLVKGGDYANVDPATIPGAAYAHRVHITDYAPGFSSTIMRERLAHAES